MSSTIARQVKSINKISKTFFEVIGDTGNSYYYDAWADCCNCPAGQHGRDCYHAKAVRQQIADEQQHQQTMEETFSHGLIGADIIGLARDMGLTVEITPGITGFQGEPYHPIYNTNPGRRIEFLHLGESLTSIVFHYGSYSVLHYGTGKIHTEQTTTVAQLQKDLERMLGYKIKSARDDIFGNWGDNKEDAPERPRLKVR